jgi:hypothetical protein
MRFADWIVLGHIGANTDVPDIGVGGREVDLFGQYKRLRNEFEFWT